MRFSLILLAFLVAGIMLGQIAYHLFLSEEKAPAGVVAEPNEAGMCFKEFLPYGEHMSWSETSAGQYDYEIYATDKGIEVWVPCE